MRAFFVLFFLSIATAAFAAEPLTSSENFPVMLSLGGYMRWYGTYTDVFRQNDASTVRRRTYNAVDVMGDAEIDFQGETQLSDDIKIGVVAQLRGGTDDQNNDVGVNEYAFYADAKSTGMWRETYLMADGAFGRFFIGNLKNAAYQLAVTAPTVSALGVEESDFTRLSDTLPVSTFPVYDNLETKISYLSPTVGGFMAGISIMPSNNTNGHDATVMKNGTLDNAQIATLLYQTTPDPYTINISLSYARYEPREGKAGENFAVGADVGAGNWTIGASFMRALYRGLDNTAVGTTGIVNGGKVNTLDIGFSYDLGLAAASVNYISLDGTNKNGVLRQKMFQTSLRYRLGAGIDIFTDAAYVSYRVGDEKRKSIGVASGFDLSF